MNLNTILKYLQILIIGFLPISSIVNDVDKLIKLLKKEISQPLRINSYRNKKFYLINNIKNKLRHIYNFLLFKINF